MGIKKLLLLSAIASTFYLVGCSRESCGPTAPAITVQVEEFTVKVDKSQHPNNDHKEVAAMLKDQLEKESGNRVSVYLIKNNDDHWVFSVRKFKRSK
jgi:ABC-type phosphate/phosphonate transport system substrate-binding protein